MKLNRWTVLDSAGKLFWSLQCSCGTKRRVNKYYALSGASKSCGCWKREVTIARNHKHGLSVRGKRHPLYSVWATMITRCTNSKSKSFVWYGARGISICQKWRTDFGSFKEWGTNSGYARGLQLDRKNNDGNYGPRNCRWVTSSQNCLNRRPKAKI